MNDYDSFGPYYDIVVGDRPELAHFLRATIRQYAPDAKTLLELGSGSGSLLKVLCKYYQSTGIDLSVEMVRLAKKRAPAATSLVGDITSFKCSGSFDAIVCVFDTMNHLSTFSAWKSVMRNAARHLSDGGVFIFDVNTAFKLERYVHEPMVAFKKGDVTCLIEVVRRMKSRYEITLSAFAKKERGLYQKYELSIPELTVPTQEIRRAALKEFRSVSIIDPNRSRWSEISEELFFVCRGRR